MIGQMRLKKASITIAKVKEEAVESALRVVEAL
jgi:hypothetical protein